MEGSQFATILKEFEAFFKQSLTPGPNDSCVIPVSEKVLIQMELDRYGMLLLGCRIVRLPLSRYRNHLITAALKFNEATLPSTGIFGFGQKHQQLIVYIKVDPKYLTPHYISSMLPPFIAKATQWIEAIEKNEIPSLASQTVKQSAGIFGLK